MPGEPAGRRVPLLPARGSALRWCFDGFYAVALPPVLIVLDNEWRPLGISIELVPYRPYAPVLAYGAILALLAWWAVRRRAGWVGALFAGPFFAGAAFAIGTGLFALPASLMGILLAGIGLLGFVPFLTGASFLDAGFEAWQAGRARFGGPRTAAIALASALLFGGACAGAGRIASDLEERETAVLVEGKPDDFARAESTLAVLRRLPGVRLAALVRASQDARDPDEARRLAGVYKRITGRDLPEFD